MSQEPASDRDELLRALVETPQRLETLSRGLSEERVCHRSEEDSWSAHEILAHLRAGADMWGGSVQAMLERDHPTLRYVSPRTWIRKTDYAQQPFSESLRAFTEQRERLVLTLRTLAPADWERGATFTGTTRGREQTILSYVQRIVTHEREHLEQFWAALAAP